MLELVGLCVWNDILLATDLILEKMFFFFFLLRLLHLRAWHWTLHLEAQLLYYLLWQLVFLTTT